MWKIGSIKVNPHLVDLNPLLKRSECVIIKQNTQLLIYIYRTTE